MRVLVCGGRDFVDYLLLDSFLCDFREKHGITTVIEGDACGVDRMAGYWARSSKIENLKFPADWREYGNDAGPIRNQQMIDEGNPDVVIAFPGSKGTGDMIRRANKCGIKVILVNASNT